MTKPSRRTSAKTGELFVRVPMPEKKSWGKAAAASGLPLARWVTQALNRMAPDETGVQPGGHREGDGTAKGGKIGAGSEAGRNVPGGAK